MITDKNKNILQQNCLECHKSLIDDTIVNHNSNNENCLHCHSSVGHGNQIGLGKITSIKKGN